MNEDTQIGSTLYVVLEDGATVTIDDNGDDEILFVLDGHGAHLIQRHDAERIHKALGAVLAGNAELFWAEA